MPTRWAGEFAAPAPTSFRSTESIRCVGFPMRLFPIGSRRAALLSPAQSPAATSRIKDARAEHSDAFLIKLAEAGVVPDR